MTTTTSAGSPPAAPVKRRSPVTEYGERFGLVGLFVVIIVFFAILPASGGIFLTAANISNVLGNLSVILVVAVAALLPLIAGHFDFSVGSVTAFTSVVCAGLQARDHFGLVPAMLVAIVLGAFIGLVNGILVARYGLNSFVSTLGMATLLGGVIQWYTGGLAIIGIDPALTTFGSSGWGPFPQVMVVDLVVVVVAWYLLTQTPFGRSLYAIGANPRSAALVGLPRRRHTVSSFLIAGVLAGVAGILLTARTGGANPDDGTSLLFPALAAVFLGATAISPGRFNVIGTVLGLLFVQSSVSGLALSTSATWVSSVFNGVALIAAVFLSSALRRRREGSDT